jgi:hypothetical protein
MLHAFFLRTQYPSKMKDEERAPSKRSSTLSRSGKRESEADAEKVEVTLKSSEALSGDAVSLDIDPVEEKKLLRKLDFILLPLFTAICESLIP